MRRRDCLRIRNVLTGDGTLWRLADGIADVVGDGVASTQKNARHTADAFRYLAALVAGVHVSMSTYALKGLEKKFTPGSMPTDEWVRRAQRRAAGMSAEGALTRQAAAHLRQLREEGHLPKTCGVAVDITNVPRQDGDRGGGSLVRGRCKGGSHQSEAHVTAQCVERGVGTVVAACRLTPRDPVAGRLSLVGYRVMAARLDPKPPSEPSPCVFS